MPVGLYGNCQEIGREVGFEPAKDWSWRFYPRKIEWTGKNIYFLR